MLIRLAQIRHAEERYANPETGQTIIVNRDARVVWYVGGATYRGADADAIIEAIDLLLEFGCEMADERVHVERDAVLREAGCLEQSERSGTVELLEGEPVAVAAREPERPSVAQCDCLDCS